jgi:hypothetical protein
MSVFCLFNKRFIFRNSTPSHVRNSGNAALVTCHDVKLSSFGGVHLSVVRFEF